VTPRILTLDIETLPAKIYSFGPIGGRPIFASIDQIIEPDRMVCFAAKWLGDKKVLFSSEWGSGREEMAQNAFDVLDEADAVVTYNGDTFDFPWINRTCEEAGLGRPSPFVSIDLYKAGRKHFRFLSHKLQWLLTSLEVDTKMAHEGFGLWRRVDQGDEKAQRTMRRYNIQDVRATEKLYLELLPWLDKHPNHNLYLEDGRPEVCPKCGKAGTLQRRGFRQTKISAYQQYWCNPQFDGCGSYPSVGKREKGVDLR